MPREEGQKIIPSFMKQDMIFQKDPKSIHIASPSEGLVDIFEA